MTPARVVLLAQAEVSENDGHDDHDSDDGKDVHDVRAHQRSTDTFTLDGRRRLPSWTWSIPPHGTGSWRARLRFLSPEVGLRDVFQHHALRVEEGAVERDGVSHDVDESL